MQNIQDICMTVPWQLVDARYVFKRLLYRLLSWCAHIEGKPFPKNTINLEDVPQYFIANRKEVNKSDQLRLDLNRS